MVLSWKIGYKINLSPENIIKERKIIMISWKWEGAREITTLTWDKDQNELPMLKAFLKVANEADEIIGHNSDSFDLPWIRTRCLILGLEPIPAYKTIDTLQWARRYHLFNSCKLDYLGEVLGFGNKLKTGFDLWKRVVLDNDRVALGKMASYCARDIELLEKVYHKLKFCVKPKTHAGVLAGHEKWSCPSCASIKVKKSKTRITAAGTTQHQMVCHSCHGYYVLANSAFNLYLKDK